MKVRAYVLIASVALLGMSAGSKKAKLTEGVNPGDLAPRIEFLGNDAKASFHNQLGRYTLLNFWAAYDAESRARNVQLANEVNKFGPDKIAMCSISMDEKESIFTETVKIDKLDLSTQFHEGLGKESELYKKYDLRKGFKNFLINDEGVIIAPTSPRKNLTEITESNLISIFSQRGLFHF